MATVCLGSKYHSSMSRGVRANEHYLLWICTGSQSSVTFYDAYLRSAASPCSDLLALSSRVSYTAALHTRLSKVQLGRFRVVLAGFIQSVRSLYVFTTLRRERSFSWGKSQESQLTQLCFPFFLIHTVLCLFDLPCSDLCPLYTLPWWVLLFLLCFQCSSLHAANGLMGSFQPRRPCLISS